MTYASREQGVKGLYSEFSGRFITSVLFIGGIF
jgi:hypothetical protein